MATFNGITPSFLVQHINQLEALEAERATRALADARNRLTAGLRAAQQAIAVQIEQLEAGAAFDETRIDKTYDALAGAMDEYYVEVELARTSESSTQASPRRSQVVN